MIMTAGRRWRNWGLPVGRAAVAVMLSAGPLVAGAADTGESALPADAAAPFVLDLPGEGTLPGQFSATADVVATQSMRWQSPLFDRPFEFRLSEVIGIRSLGHEPEAAPDAAFRCRLHGGDTIDGDIVAIDADQVVFAPAGSEEPVRIARSLVSSLARKAVGETAGYVGPAGLAGWEQQPASSWRDEVGRIATDQPNSVLSRDVGAAARARYDIAISWRDQAEFVLAVAAGADSTGLDAYRFERLLIGGEVPAAMIVRQEPGRSEIAEVSLADLPQSQIRLSLFVDQTVGRLVVVLADSQETVDVAIPPAVGRQQSPRFRLTVRSGDMSLDSLRVTEWQGADPVAANPAETEVVGRDGAVIRGSVESLDSGAGRLAIRTAEGGETVSLANVQELRFPVAGGAAAEHEWQPRMRAVRWSGGVVSGDLAAVSDTAVAISREGVEGPIAIPFADLRSLARSRPAGATAANAGDIEIQEAARDAQQPRIGRLLMPGLAVPGCLAPPDDARGGLGWRPHGSDVAAAFAVEAFPNLGATVDYLPPEEKREAALDDMVDVGGVGGAVNQDENGAFVITMLAEEGAAARDGRIEPGDRILAIRPVEAARFVETRGLDLETVMNLLRGRVGTRVSVRIERAAGGAPEEIDLVRGLIYVAERNVLDQALAAHARLAANQAVAAGEAAGFPALAILTSGDVVAAAIESIGPEGVALRSPVTASRGREPVTVAHALIQAVELDPAAASRPLERARWERLLTLPRSQRDNPPTHLLRLRSGDYLRGNLESLTADHVEFRVMGQRKEFPREAVVRVIWLHPEMLDLDGDDEPDGERPTESPEVAGLVVQGVAAGGERTTLVADRVDAAAIVGTSPAFGPSRIDTNRIDRLLIGKAVTAADEALPYSQWRLRLAPEPRALRESEP